MSVTILKALDWIYLARIKTGGDALNVLMNILLCVSDRQQGGSHYTSEQPTVKLPITSHFGSINGWVFHH
jgi:hypothetical protein